MRDKSGITVWRKNSSWLYNILISILIIVIVFSYLLAFCGSIKIFGIEISIFEGSTSSTYYNIGTNSYKNVSANIAEQGWLGYYYKGLYWSADKLGFNTGYKDIETYGTCWGWILNKTKAVGVFLGDLFIGALAGFWLYAVYVISKILNRLNKTALKSQWLVLMGSSLWKIIAIGVGYAVLMQVPIVNAFINIITLQIKPFNLNFFIRSFIIAFYIGLGPAWIESYQKYRLRIKAEKAIIAAQSRAKLERTSLK